MTPPDDTDNPGDGLTPDERRLEAALHAAADRIEPTPGGLEQIRARIGARAPWWRRAAVLAPIGAVAAGAVAVAVVLSQNGPADETVVLPSDASSATPTQQPTLGVSTPSPTPTPDPTSPGGTGEATDAPPDAQPVAVPVYYAADAADETRLAREFRAVPAPDGVVTAAVRQMVEGSSDPDYRSLWAAGTSVTGTRLAGDVIEVDFAEAPALADDAGPAGAQLAAQQLVYTATAAATLEGTDGAVPVRVLVQGAPVDTLFGSVDASEPLERTAELEVRQLVQVNNPVEGAEVAAPVRVDGQAAAFEANLTWEVRADGAVVDRGQATAEECCRFAPFAFDLDLEPGTYELVVSEVDESDGEGRPPMSDTKTFTVTP